MSIYISTGAFKTRDIEKILVDAEKCGIYAIEISPGLNYCKRFKDALFENKDDFDILVHNYFPPQRRSFALNLASNNSKIIDLSMNMCKKAIDFSSQMGIPFYSIHCGYCFDTKGSDLGNESQLYLPQIPYDLAKRSFIRNIRILCDYAKSKHIKIAIENNVMAGFAKGNKELYLGVDTDDLIELIDLINRPNVGILLDLAHAQVSDSFLHFGIAEMIEKLKNLILEVHLSENDGYSDQNLPLHPDSRLLSYLRLLDHVPITLEVYNLEPAEMIEQIKLVNSFVSGF